MKRVAAVRCDRCIFVCFMNGRSLNILSDWVFSVKVALENSHHLHLVVSSGLACFKRGCKNDEKLKGQVLFYEETLSL